MKKTLFIKNALILTVSSLILRFVGIIFKVWLAKLIGSEGIGLYQLVFSVYMLASTFAASGICTAVTRLIAEELAVGTKKGAVKIMRRSVELTLIIAAATVITVFSERNLSQHGFYVISVPFRRLKFFRFPCRLWGLHPA